MRGRNNIVLTGIPHNVSNCDLEDTLTSILSNTVFNVTGNDTEACHRMGKPDKKYKS